MKMRRKMNDKLSKVISTSFYPVWSLFETSVALDGNSGTYKIMSIVRLLCVVKRKNIKIWTQRHIYREYLKQGCCKEENRWWPQRRVCVPRSHSSQPSLVCSKTCLQLWILRWRIRIRRSKVRWRSSPFLESLKYEIRCVCKEDGF